MVDGRRFENGFIAKLAADHLISMKFDADANFNTKTRHVTKIKTLQILSTRGVQ